VYGENMPLQQAPLSALIAPRVRPHWLLEALSPTTASHVRQERIILWKAERAYLVNKVGMHKRQARPAALIARKGHLVVSQVLPRFPRVSSVQLENIVIYLGLSRKAPVCIVQLASHQTQRRGQASVTYRQPGNLLRGRLANLLEPPQVNQLLPRRSRRARS